MSKPYEAVVAGHLCLDIYPDLSETAPGAFADGFVPGRLLEGGPLLFCTGGAVSNTGLSMVRLGIPVYLVGRIGDDLLGQEVRRIVGSCGQELLSGVVVDPTVNTSYTLVISPPETDRSFLYYPGAHVSFGPEHVDWAAVAQARLFHFGYPPTLPRMYRDGGVELEEVFRRAKDTGATTSLDMTLPHPLSPAGSADWRLILTRALPYVDLFLPSIEEALYAVRRPVYDALRSAAKGGDILPLVDAQLLSSLSVELLKMGARMVGLKLGHRGFYLRTAGLAALQQMGKAAPKDSAGWAQRELWAPCFQVQVVGTTGAGDSTIAGFLAALLRGLSAAEAVTAAVAVGACNVEAADSLSGVRSWEETWDRVHSGWRRHELKLHDAGWTWDASHQLWSGPADGATAAG
jgi:sugar/nucleoside kinase (ribokinase family)